MHSLSRLSSALIRFVKTFFSLDQTFFDSRELGKLGFLFLLEFDFCLEEQIFGFQLGFFHKVLCFALGLLHSLSSCSSSCIFFLAPDDRRISSKSNSEQPAMSSRSQI